MHRTFPTVENIAQPFFDGPFIHLERKEEKDMTDINRTGFGFRPNFGPSGIGTPSYGQGGNSGGGSGMGNAFPAGGADLNQLIILIVALLQQMMGNGSGNANPGAGSGSPGAGGVTLGGANPGGFGGFGDFGTGINIGGGNSAPGYAGHHGGRHMGRRGGHQGSHGGGYHGFRADDGRSGHGFGIRAHQRGGRCG